MEVKECISRFRRLDAELRDHNRALDAAREEYNTLDAEHATRVAEWEAEKASLTAVIDKAIEDEATVACDAEDMEKAAEELLAKVAQRQRKNEEHKTTLHKHRAEIERQTAELELRDAAIKSELASFREARDATREQLLSTIAEMEAVNPRVRAEHTEKVAQLRQQIEAVEVRISQESRTWALGLARQERDEKRRCMKLLNEEAQAAAEGRAMWNEMLRAAVPVSCAAETAKEVAYLRHKLLRSAA